MNCPRPGQKCNEYSCGGNDKQRCARNSESKMMLDYVKRCEREAKRDAIISFRKMIYDRAWISATDQQKIDCLADEFLESINDD